MLELHVKVPNKSCHDSADLSHCEILLLVRDHFEAIFILHMVTSLSDTTPSPHRKRLDDAPHVVFVLCIPEEPLRRKEVWASKLIRESTRRSLCNSDAHVWGNVSATLHYSGLGRQPRKSCMYWRVYSEGLLDHGVEGQREERHSRYVV